MRIPQCMLEGVMPDHMDYKHACIPNGDPKSVLQRVKMPYSVCYKRACNSNDEYPTMRITKRDNAPQYVWQASL
eukprot:5793772-Pleurochrysis_carterae.AAC.1